MNRAFFWSPLFMAVLALDAQALEVQIDPHADLLYRQALPLLEQADLQTTAPAHCAPRLAATGTQPPRPGPGANPTHRRGLAEKSVALNHPVAQYRLALYYMTYLPTAQIPDAACPLLEASLQQGFAPPAPAIATWCPPYNASPAYRQALEAIPSMATRYAAYYPQPAIRLACNRSQPQGLEMQWGRQRDYQAEVYRLLGDLDPQQRQTLLQKAVDINGCAAAQRHLTSKR